MADDTSSWSNLKSRVVDETDDAFVFDVDGQKIRSAKGVGGLSAQKQKDLRDVLAAKSKSKAQPSTFGDQAYDTAVRAKTAVSEALGLGSDFGVGLPEEVPAPPPPRTINDLYSVTARELEQAKQRGDFAAASAAQKKIDSLAHLDPLSPIDAPYLNEVAAHEQIAPPAGMNTVARPESRPAVAEAPAGAGGVRGALARTVTAARPAGSSAPPRAPDQEQLAQADYQRAQRDQQVALQAEANNAAKLATAQGAYQTEIANQAEKLAAEQAQREGDRRRFMDGQVKQLQALQDEFNKTSTQINPKRLFGDLNFGQRLVAGLGVFLGSIPGGENRALGMVQTTIDRDIAAQQATLQAGLAKRGQAVAQGQNLLGIMRQQFGDEAAAESAARSTMLQNAATRLEAMAATYKAPEIQAKAQAGVAQLRQAAAQEAQGFVARTQERAMKAALTQSEIRKNNAAAYHDINSGKSGAGEDPALFVPGLGFALDKEAAKQARETKATFDKTAQKLERLIDYRKKYGSETIPGEAKSAMRALGNQVMLALNKSDKLGALDEGSVKILKEMIGGDPTSYGFVLPALETIKKSLNDDMVADLTPYMRPGPGVTSPAGRPHVPKAR